jgi:hypothetical protein
MLLEAPTTDDAAHTIAHMTHDTAPCKQHATGNGCDRRWMHRACLSCRMHGACHLLSHACMERVVQPVMERVIQPVNEPASLTIPAATLPQFHNGD